MFIFFCVLQNYLTKLTIYICIDIYKKMWLSVKCINLKCLGYYIFDRKKIYYNGK